MNDKEQSQFNKDIFELAKAIKSLHEQKKTIIIEKMDFIIKNKITDENRIEHLIDEFMDLDLFINMKEYFKILLRYYSKINLQATIQYIQMYKEYNERDF
jgi:hypothetical protein